MKPASIMFNSKLAKFLGFVLGAFLLSSTLSAQDMSGSSLLHGMGFEAILADVDINVYELIKNKGGPIVYPLAMSVAVLMRVLHVSLKIL